MAADDDVDPSTIPSSPTSPIRIPPENNATRSRASSSTSSGIMRRASIKFLESGPPLGAWHAAGEALGKAPTPNDIVKGKFSHDGWDPDVQYKHSQVGEEGARRLPRRTSSGQVPTSPIAPSGLHAHVETDESEERNEPEGRHVPQALNEPLPPFAGRGEMTDQMFIRPTNRPATVEKRLVIPDPKEERPFHPGVADPLNVSKLEGMSTAVRSDASASTVSLPAPSVVQVPDADGVYPNGYKFPPKHTRAEATKIGFKAFCKYVITIQGFLVVVYCLNVVAWGGMLFLLLVGGGNQYMCYPERLHGIKDCSDLYSPRRIWLEIDSQILNALFCVTGLGLIPWRFRDLYYLLQWRLLKKSHGLRMLGGIHNGWFRLPGSHHLPVSKDEGYTDTERKDNPAIPIPYSKLPPPPLTGNRAPDTKTWKLDFVIWAMVLNTFLQIVLCGFMWGYNRFDRPSWATGTFIALACVVAGAGGIMTFFEAKKVKAVEGIPVEDEGKKDDAEVGGRRDEITSNVNEKN